MPININNTNIGVSGTFWAESEKAENRRTFFAGEMNLNDPIAKKRKEAQKKAMKVVSDAWNTDKEIDKSIEDRRNHYNKLLDDKKEAQSHLNDIDKQVNALKEEYGITEDMKYRDWPAEFKQRYFELNNQASEFKAQIYDADKLMKDDLADIRAISIERLKSSPMADAQETADAIIEAANKEIVDIAMQESKEHIEEKMEETQEKAEKEAEKKEIEEEKLENIRENKAMQEAMIEGTKEAIAEAKAKHKENEAPDLPLEDLVKLAQVNSETNKAQKALKDIKNSMSLLEADLTGIKVDEEI